MKKSANIIIPLLIVGALTPFTAKALTATSSGSVSNNFMFIENAIDGEYFITPSSLDPRFSGSNTWVKYGTSQV
ncbi:TPA: fimbrial protein, partial [Enterobacter cloacae]|nr:fimbrial protein [Enterobacter cloacae]